MKKVYLGLIAFLASMMLVVSAVSQPPEDKEKKGPPDKKGGPRGGFELGRILPPFMRDELDLTEEQEKKIAELEKEVKAKLSKILTEAQKEKIQSMRPKGPPKGGPDGKKGPPDGDDDGPKGKFKKDPPPEKD